MVNPLPEVAPWRLLEHDFEVGRTLVEKIWDAHAVARRADGKTLVYMDRCVVDEVRAPHVFEQLELKKHVVRRTDLTFVVQDHSVATSPGRDEMTNPDATEIIRATRAAAHRHGVRLFDLDDPSQGISHVVAPEIGMTLPGATYACADSHAATVGGLGVLAFGCGSTELIHLLSTQTMALVRPRQMRLTLEGALSEGVTAKDVIMHVVAKLGVEGAAGAAIEFAGSLTRALPTEARFTLCNMAIEMNARTAIVAPDDETFRWLKGKPMAPKGVDWEGAVARWRLLRGDDDARFDDEVVVDCARLEPQISWGIDPSQTIGISQRVPDDTVKAGRKSRAHEYMGLIPGDPIAGIAVNRVFIGSCTNARLSDLESAAEVAHGRRVAPGVTAIVVPGSMSVRREAEARGLDVIFRAAGFEWHNAGCSMCAGGSGARANPGERIVSTSNRNFEGRQGRDVRTHLASPAMAAAAAVTGSIVDVRRLLAGGA